MCTGRREGTRRDEPLKLSQRGAGWGQVPGAGRDRASPPQEKGSPRVPGTPACLCSSISLPRGPGLEGLSSNLFRRVR